MTIKSIFLNGPVVRKCFCIALTVFLITFLNAGSVLAGDVPAPMTGDDVIFNFTEPITFTDGMVFGAYDALTLETAGSPTFSIIDNSYLLATSPAISDGFLIRSTNPLPATYKVTVDMGDIHFDLANPGSGGSENGVYLPTISAFAGSPTTNDWWHENRKVHMDIDNNEWGSGGEHPVFFGYYDQSSVTADYFEDGQWVYDGAEESWGAISEDWASAFNYDPDMWYTFEIEKTETTYFYRIFDALTGELLQDASIPIDSVRSGDDFFTIGDPHTNYYNGSVGISNLRITGVTPEPVSTVLFLIGGLPIAVSLYRKRKRA